MLENINTVVQQSINPMLLYMQILKMKGNMKIDLGSLSTPFSLPRWWFCGVGRSTNFIILIYLFNASH